MDERLLKQQTSITVYRLPTKEKNFRFPFAENKLNFDDSGWCIFIYIYNKIYVEAMESFQLDFRDVQDMFIFTENLCDFCNYYLYIRHLNNHSNSS